MRIKWTVFFLFFGWVPASLASAWEYPVIKGYGAIQPLANAAIQPDKSIKYRVLFDITGKSERIYHANPGLSHVARFINLMASGGVKPGQMELVAIIHGEATPFVLRNEVFKETFQLDNPNIQIIKDLKAAG